jgi:hypothetical protein
MFQHPFINSYWRKTNYTSCWHVYRKSVFVIDGKNNNDDGKQERKYDSTGISPLLRR